MSSSERILVVGPSWVGDMVMAQSLFISLKQRWPACSIDVLAPEWSVPVLARMPQVRNGIPMSLGHGQFNWSVRRRLGRSLAGQDYSRAIVLPRSFKAALVPFHAGIPVRTGYRGEMRYGLINDMRPLDKTVLTQTVQRFVALGQPRDAGQPPHIPAPVLRVSPDNQAALMQQFELADTAVALLPGAEYGPAKCWPLEYFADAAKVLGERGYQVWVLGSQKDAAAGDMIAAGSGGAAVNLCGKTRLEDAIDLLAASQAVITNDSGLMHVAAAVDTQVIAIYGSTTPDFTPPLTDNAQLHYLRLACSPCFKRECPLGHLDCLKKIDVARVVAELPGVTWSAPVGPSDG
ncbi:MAG: lipopolysaccharide heptosyltransferase II [Gammaproteobacteria bacterium]|nr:lipopolysaccharide heptosyltransferase II [Gammaproteobacteria bacterium]